MAVHSNQEIPPPLPSNGHRAATSAPKGLDAKSSNKVGWLGRLFWNPARPGENWAQTLVRVLGNLLRWIIGLPILVGLIVWGASSLHNWWAERPYYLTGLEGVEIGMTMTDVTLLKGAPTARWVQGITFGDDLLVFFNGASEDALRVSRVCLTEPKYWDSVIGVSGGDNEAKVTRHLGQPDSTVVDDDGLGKRLFFEDYNLILRFEKALVVGICVGT